MGATRQTGTCGQSRSLETKTRGDLPHAVRATMLVLLACAVPWMGHDAKADASAQEETRAATAAAQRFLKTLDEGQAGQAILPLGSPLIANWSNLPAKNTRFERNGVRVGDLSAGQRAALSDFLSKALSPAGHELVRGVIEAERVLAGFFGELLWGLSPDDYWLAFFGTPAAGQDWSWQFGGHHLAVNVAVRDGVMSMSPSFIGIEPATFESDGTQWAPLADHVARGAALVEALPDPQRQAAAAGSRPRELHAGAGRDGVIPPPEGSLVGDWTEARQRQLMELIGLWVRVMPQAAAERRLAEIERERSRLRFAWYGPTDGSDPIYYRIQGPTLIIEFSATGDHYHSIYRNPTNEYGGA